VGEFSISLNVLRIICSDQMQTSDSEVWGWTLRISSSYAELRGAELHW